MNDFTIGRALGRSFTIWIRNLVPFLLLSLLVYSPLALFTYLNIEGTISMSPVAFSGLLGGISVLLNFVLSAALVYGVVNQLRGQTVPIAQCLGMGVRRLVPVLGVALLVIVAVTLGVLALVVPGIILYCMFFVAIPASVVERPGLFGALGRSRSLTRDYRAAIFGLLVLVGIISFVLQKILEVGVTPAVSGSLGVWLLLAQHIMSGSFSAVLQGVVYHDLRVAKEGAHTEDLARVFD